MDIFVTQISRQIQEWLDRNPCETVASLSRATGISDTTLRRLKAGKTEPDPETVSALLPILDTDHAFGYIERTRAKDLHEWSETFISRLQSVSAFIEECTRTIHGLVLIELCADGDGISFNRLARFIGLSVKESLNLLIEHDFIREDLGKLSLIHQIYRIIPCPFHNRS